MKDDWNTFWPRIIEATGETLYMVILTLIFGSILGITIGLLLFVTRENNILESKIPLFSLDKCPLSPKILCFSAYVYGPT